MKHVLLQDVRHNAHQAPLGRDDECLTKVENTLTGNIPRFVGTQMQKASVKAVQDKVRPLIHIKGRKVRDINNSKIEEVLFPTFNCLKTSFSKNKKMKHNEDVEQKRKRSEIDFSDSTKVDPNEHSHKKAERLQ